MTNIRLNNISLKYVEYGNSEPLVLVHGSASDYRTWESQLNSFSKYFRTIAYSRRYHWPNEKIPEDSDYSITEHKQDLINLLHALDANPAHLVGHSYGAFICLLLALQHPNMIRSMVLAEPPVITLYVSNTPKPIELIKLLSTRPRTAIPLLRLGINGFVPASKAAKRGDMNKAMEVFGRAVLGRKFYNQLSATRLEQVEDNAIKAEFLGSGYPSLELNTLRSIEVPTLLVIGQQSPKVFHRLSDKLEELLPNTKRVQIPDASHIMYEDNPEAFHNEVISFLTNYKQSV
jgi:pimeloyl-ACP methyl ester carboxylesterase